MGDSGRGPQAGWHAHLDLLQAPLDVQMPRPFWDHWNDLKRDCAQRLRARTVVLTAAEDARPGYGRLDRWG